MGPLGVDRMLSVGLLSARTLPHASFSLPYHQVRGGPREAKIKERIFPQGNGGLTSPLVLCSPTSSWPCALKPGALLVRGSCPGLRGPPAPD